MFGAFQEYLFKLAVMTTTLWIVAAVAWWIMAKSGWLKAGSAFNALDMRTWTLRFMLIDAAAFAATFATASMWLDVVYCSAIAAIVAVAVVPMIASRLAGATPKR